MVLQAQSCRAIEISLIYINKVCSPTLEDAPYLPQKIIIMKKILSTVLLLALCALTGCFDEPIPAAQTVRPDQRVYLNDRGLKDLSSVALAADIDYLNLDRNQLTNVAPVVALKDLKWLRLNGNRLTTLPDLSALTALRRIYLKDNRFAAVPETLKDLPALTDIDLSGNPIKEVPAWLAEKKGLKNLSFTRTQLNRLPEDLSAWRSLATLQLGDLMLKPEEMARIRAALPRTAVVY